MAGPTQAASAPASFVPGSFRAMLGKHADLVLAAAVVTIVGMMIIPLPTIILDLFIVGNMAMSVVLLLVAIYITAALKIATFPTLLLLTTLFRLALEVSATRLILLHADGGSVIHAFGNFVVAGNLVVGAVIFFILTMIQFIVIAKGSERVSEVGARFTLDAMPGKQMSIDAELRAGHIDHTEARRRRTALGRESQFFGSMDGAMKFVKGDAIAGIIVLVTNIVGGLVIGIVQRGMDASTAAHTYTVLTIGEGLVSQIPALIISTAAGIIVTRVASEEEGSNLGREMFGQLTGQPKAIAIAAGLMVLLAIVPGFPTVPFLVLAALLGYLAWHLIGAQKIAEAAKSTAAAKPGAPGAAAAKPGAPPGAGTAAAPVPPAAPVPLRLPVQIGLSNDLTDALFPDGTTGDFFEEVIPGVRGSYLDELGILLPGIRLQGRVQGLEPTQYEFRLAEVPMVKGSVVFGHFLVHAPPEVLAQQGLTGEAAPLHEGGTGVWVTASLAEKARESRYRVSSPRDAMIWHLGRFLRDHAADFVGIEETQAMLDGLSRTHPIVVKEVVPRLVSLVVLTDVLRRLADEGVSLRGLLTILHALAEWAPLERDPMALTEHVRTALRRQIINRCLTAEGTLAVYLLDPMIEESIRESIQRTPTGSYLALDPTTSRSIVKAISTAIGGRVTPFVILTSSEIRRFVRRLVEAEHPRVAVLSFQELTAETKLQQLGRIKGGG
jgi:type III secretion protein V